MLRGKIKHFKYFGGQYNFPIILFKKKFIKKGHKKDINYFFTGALPPKCPAVITPLSIMDHLNISINVGEKF
jgi:hypothetical protein